MVKAIKKQYSVAPTIAKQNNIQSYRFRGFQSGSQKTITWRVAKPCLPIVIVRSFWQLQKTLLTGLLSTKTQTQTSCCLYIKGPGTLRTHLGNLDFKYGDYLLIPRGIIYQIDFDTQDNRLFIVESRRPIYTPKRYRNWFGQHLEHSPFCERDIRVPHELDTNDEKGDFLIKVKKNNDAMIEMVYASHPFDVVGYDGYNYPYAFSIHDFEPITGRIHQPPPVHQTFETDAFVVCSFCPRLYDYHPLSIPAPYNHSNIDSDEVLYYVDGRLYEQK